MNNQETLQEYNTRLEENNISLNDILTTINELPDNNSSSMSILYSSDEFIIGTWYGKPLYTKTLRTNISFTGNVDVQHSVSNYEEMWIDHSKSYYKNANINLPLVRNSYWGDFSQKTDALVYKDKIILYSDGGWGTDWEKVITINYTKTTD